VNARETIGGIPERLPEGGIRYKVASMTLMDRLANALLEREGVEERRSRFGHKVAFYRGGREFLHLHRAQEADIRLGRERIRERRADLQEQPGVRLRESPSSDWVIVALEREEDVDFVLELADDAMRG
jgi:hypothetical protein